MLKLKKVFIPVAAVVLVVGYSGSANANKAFDFWQELKDLKWEDGRLRFEGQSWASTRSGHQSRRGDYAVAGTLEREFALDHKLSVGVRAIPLFFLSEKDRRDDDGNTILGVGLGVSIRYYTEEVQDGWFVEFSESLIGQSDTFRRNSGRVNLMSEVGVGYEFDNDWHVALKFRHLSNGGIASRNAGVNGIGVGVGFSF